MEKNDGSVNSIACATIRIPEHCSEALWEVSNFLEEHSLVPKTEPEHLTFNIVDNMVYSKSFIYDYNTSGTIYLSFTELSENIMKKLEEVIQKFGKDVFCSSLPVRWMDSAF